MSIYTWWIQLSGRYLGREGYNLVNLYVVDTVVNGKTILTGKNLVNIQVVDTLGLCNNICLHYDTHTFGLFFSTLVHKKIKIQ